MHRTEHNVRLLMTAAMGVHTLEALLTGWLCWQAGLGHEQLMGWCSLTLLLGYGAIRPLMQQIKAAKSKAAAAATGKAS
ncbi:hypothetical protein OEZ86_010327 [Tetradesmus obliquus]|nr:hypothetical protein OEZ86_010327 [Tetradesmus obliquus]